jgi:hypothetical protein
MKADDVDLLSRMSEIHATRIHHTYEVGIHGQNDRWDFKNSVDDDTLSHWMNLTAKDNMTK